MIPLWSEYKLGAYCKPVRLVGDRRATYSWAMKLWVLLILLAVTGSATAFDSPVRIEHYDHKERKVVGDVTLGDGRVLRQVRVLRAGPDSLNLATDRGIVTIARKLLPADFSAANPEIKNVGRRSKGIWEYVPTDITLKDGRKFKGALPANLKPDGTGMQFTYEGGFLNNPASLITDCWPDMILDAAIRRNETESKLIREKAQQRQAQLRREAQEEFEAKHNIGGQFLVSLTPDAGGRGAVLVVRDRFVVKTPLNVKFLSYRLSTGEQIRDCSGLFDPADLADLRNKTQERSYHLHWPEGKTVMAIGWTGWLDIEAWVGSPKFCQATRKPLEPEGGTKTLSVEYVNP